MCKQFLNKWQNLPRQNQINVSPTIRHNLIRSPRYQHLNCIHQVLNRTAFKYILLNACIELGQFDGELEIS